MGPRVLSASFTVRDWGAPMHDARPSFSLAAKGLACFVFCPFAALVVAEPDGKWSRRGYQFRLFQGGML